MARVPSKHDHNHPMDWELSLKDKEKKLKSQPDTEKMKTGTTAVDRRNKGESTSVNHASTAREDNYLKKFDAVSHLSSGVMAEDSSVDANSEKELGNEFFKQRKYKEAVDCYSRSLALSPTAVAYANRAMAYLKLKRFQEAEDDCTEALNLDDRYIKAYARRSTARKELGKLKDAKEDADFALRLEPSNQEIKKQYAEAKSLYDKELLTKASASIKGPAQGELKELKLSNGKQSTPRISETTRAIAITTEHPESNKNIGKNAAKESVQKLAARAASLAAAEAAKNIAPPTSAYQFEASWRGFAGDRALQARFLKATNPVALPQIFKNALSASLLVDIIRCIATFFSDDTDLAVKYLENLPSVPRFNTIIMCLSPADKSDLKVIWDDMVRNKEVALAPEILQQLRPKYSC